MQFTVFQIKLKLILIQLWTFSVPRDAQSNKTTIRTVLSVPPPRQGIRLARFDAARHALQPAKNYSLLPAPCFITSLCARIDR